MAKRKGASTSGPRTRSKAAKEGRDAREVDPQRMDNLPQELWEKILDHLESDDLFPLALSCRYFRQKQKELVVRSFKHTASWCGRPVTLETSLKRKLREVQPASPEYLRFLSKEKVSKDVERYNDSEIVRLAAFHGHLPLLQELIERLRVGDLRKGGLGKEIAGNAGESSFPTFLLVSGSDFLLSLSSSQRADAKWKPCGG